jgi:cytochrome c-type biogenesis protein CcmH
MNDTIESLKQKLAQLKELHASGVLPDAEFAEGKNTLERRILDLVLSGATAPASDATSAAVASSVPAAAPAKTAGSAAAPAAAPASAAKPSGLMLTGLAVAIVVLAAGGYLWKGMPAGATTTAAAEGAPATAADGTAAPHSTNTEQIAAMTEKLAERLKAKPDDVEGWSMLARSYSVLGRHAEALKAYEKASNLRKDDATLMADYADSLAVNSNSSLEGEPMKLVERALKLDPKNLKALYLSGTYSYNKKDYANAVKIWEKLAEVGPAGNVFVREVEPAIAEARNLAGLPPAPKPLDAAPLAVAGAQGAAASGNGATGGAAGATVSGSVTLSAALAKQAQPDDTLFVFARAAEGSRMPLAILRKQVKDLPLTFSLNDSMAMSPANALSAASGKIIVGARVSKSGNAMPQPGDLTGQSAPVGVGAAGLQIEIKEAVKP